MTLTVEGPADVDLVSLDRVFCRRGKLRARVPEGAEGFVVASVESAVIDQGTEFGLNVGADGKSQVMVFEGQAEAALLDASGAAKRPSRSSGARPSSSTPAPAGSRRPSRGRTGSSPAPALAASSLALDPELRRRGPASRGRGATGGSSPWSTARSRTRSPAARRSASAAPSPSPGAAGGMGVPCSRPDAPEQFLDHRHASGNWPRTPGHAVELWFLAGRLQVRPLVGPVPAGASKSPASSSFKYLHTFLFETKGRGCHALHKPASVRFLHRWPLDVKVADNVYSGGGITSPCAGTTWWRRRTATGSSSTSTGCRTAAQLEPDHPTLSCRLVVGRRTPAARSRRTPGPSSAAWTSSPSTITRSRPRRSGAIFLLPDRGTNPSKPETGLTHGYEPARSPRCDIRIKKFINNF